MRFVAAFAVLAVLCSGLAVLTGWTGAFDRWLDRLGRSGMSSQSLGKPPPAPGSALVPASEPSGGRELGVEEWGRLMGEEVRALTDAEPAEKVLSPSTRLVRSSPGHYVFEGLGRAAFRSDGKGGWEPVSFEPALLASGPVAATYGGTMVPTSFGRDGGPAVSFDVDGHAVRLAPQALAIGEPKVDGPVVTYSGVAAATDLKYKVQGDGVKEFVVLRDASAPRRFQFHLSDPDGVLGDPVTEGDGSLVWSGTGMSDKRVTIPAAFAYPSDVNGTLDTSRATPDVKQTSLAATPAGDGWDLDMAVDEAWYAAQNGPVTLDPSIHYSYAYGRPGFTTWGAGASYSGSVAKLDGAPCNPQNCPTVVNNQYWMMAGTNGAPYNDQARAVIGWNYNMDFASHKYDYAPSPGMNVPLRAQINYPETWLKLGGISPTCLAGASSTAAGAYCNPAVSTYTMHNLKAPAHNGMTWANTPFGPALAETPARMPAEHYNDHYFKGSYNRFQIQPLVQEWVNDPNKAYGLMIKMKDGQENTTPKGAWWYSSNAVDNHEYTKDFQPFLRVDFNETAPDWSNKTSVPTPTPVGSTVKVTGTETDLGTYGIWYAAALVNAETGTVAKWSPVRSTGSGPLEWTFNDVPAGNYYIVENGWNHATDDNGPAEGWTKSGLFAVGSSPEAAGAGREAWWNFEDKVIGPQAVAGVNVGNGNLVVQHADSTAVQGHGRLSLGVERAYNSKTPEMIGLGGLGGLGGIGGIGNGWSFVTSGMGDGAIEGAGLAVDPIGLTAQDVKLARP